MKPDYLTPEQISVDDNLLRNPILSIFSFFLQFAVVDWFIIYLL